MYLFGELARHLFVAHLVDRTTQDVEDHYEHEE